MSGSSAGGFGGLSGGLSGGSVGSSPDAATVDTSDSDDSSNPDSSDIGGAPVASAGSGGIVKSFLSLSGPILSSSSSSAKGGQLQPAPIDDSEE